MVFVLFLIVYIISDGGLVWWDFWGVFIGISNIYTLDFSFLLAGMGIVEDAGCVLNRGFGFRIAYFAEGADLVSESRNSRRARNSRKRLLH